MRAFGANGRSPLITREIETSIAKRADFLLNLSSEMQTVIQVIATGTGSLREKIMTDPQLGTV